MIECNLHAQSLPHTKVYKMAVCIHLFNFFSSEHSGCVSTAVTYSFILWSHSPCGLFVVGEIPFAVTQHRSRTAICWSAHDSHQRALLPDHCPLLVDFSCLTVCVFVCVHACVRACVFVCWILVSDRCIYPLNCGISCKCEYQCDVVDVVMYTYENAYSKY